MPIFLVAIFLSLASCEKPAEIQTNESLLYSSFREIPGVTQEEINAIEALQKKGTGFIYGMNVTTEAFYGENNEIRGYTALFCEYLSHLFGLNFKPAIYEWDPLITGLEDGSIDFTGELTATEERRKTYYMTNTIAERSVKYFRIKNSAPIEEIARSRPLRYAFLEGTITANAVSPFIDERTEIMFVSDHNNVHDMLLSGQIDAFFEESASEAFFDIYDDVYAKDFQPLICSPVSMSTRNPELEPVISIVQKMLQSKSIRHLTDMYSRGQEEYMRHRFLKYNLDEKELEYVKTHPVVYFVAEYDNYPMSFYNTHENKWQGIFFDALKEMEIFTGISFKQVNDQFTEWSELLKMLEDGRASIISELIPSKDRLNRFLWPNRSLLQDRYALISKESFPYASVNGILHLKIGLFKNTAHTELFRTWFPNHPNTVEYEDTDEAFSALERGDVDMVMASQNLLLTLTNYMEFPGYKINILFDHPFESFLGFNKDEHVLHSIIDKVFTQMDVKKISEKWRYKTYDYRVKVAQSRLPWLIGVSVLLLCVIVLLLVLYHKTLNEEKRLESLVQKRTAELSEQYRLLEHISMTDQLTDIPNRRNFDNRLDLEWRRAIRDKLPISFMILDVDRFKVYNDTHGHQKGDLVLKSVASGIRQMIKRPGDFAARWGGEEFVVLLPNTNSKGALNVAESIRLNIEKTTVVTVSIGVNTQIPEHGTSLDHFISAADDALYKAKETGRNRVSAALT
ncbi:MAG: diguanylate cyclase [Candidatus Fibromonas sp.]|jgi:diguanylate cyclase (GGDEF)-like protein|nr:diguanylate cyclase [Candidatus Fibromonas sp.]